MLETSGTKNFQHLITTGTGGGIWDSIDVGDVVVTSQARFGLTLPAAEQALRFSGASNIKGAAAESGFANWFDYVNSKLIHDNDCVANELFTSGGREKSSGIAKIHYQSEGANINAVVTNSHIANNHIDEEKANLDKYKTMGASLDENDAYVAQACKSNKLY